MAWVTSFLSEHRGVILSHFDQLDPIRSNIFLTPTFLMALDVISQVSSLVHVSIQKLQAKRTVSNQQSYIIKELIESLKRMACAQGPLDVEKLSALDFEQYFLYELYVVAKEDLERMVQDLGGAFAFQSLENTDINESKIMLKTIAEMYLHIIQGFSKIVAIRDSQNNSDVEMFYLVITN